MNFIKKVNDFGLFGSVKDIKFFTEAVIKTAEDGNMCHMKDYERETGNNIPQEIWDYIYKLTNDK